MKKMLLVTSILAVCAAAPAFAHMDGDVDHKAMAESMFKNMDANGDGYITKEEYDSAKDKMFREMDANGDGKISKEEFMAHKKKEHDMMKSSMSDRSKTSEDAKSTTNGSATTNSK